MGTPEYDLNKKLAEDEAYDRWLADQEASLAEEFFEKHGADGLDQDMFRRFVESRFEMAKEDFRNGPEREE